MPCSCSMPWKPSRLSYFMFQPLLQIVMVLQVRSDSFEFCTNTMFPFSRSCSGYCSSARNFTLRVEAPFYNLESSSICFQDHLFRLGLSPYCHQIQRGVAPNLQSDETVPAQPVQKASRVGGHDLLYRVCSCLFHISRTTGLIAKQHPGIFDSRSTQFCGHPSNGRREDYPGCHAAVADTSNCAHPSVHPEFTKAVFA